MGAWDGVLAGWNPTQSGGDRRSAPRMVWAEFVATFPECWSLCALRYLSDSLQHHGLPVPDIQELPKPRWQGAVQQRRCSVCAAFLRLTHTILDARSGKTVRLYQCQRGERVWDD
jgi:hypothetical protein